jgi:chromate reductase, NAD(P)H dehydrogenase (quinone)
MSSKTIFAIPGSLRAGSSNHNILKYQAKLTPAGVNFSIYEDLGTIPPFNPGLDDELPPGAIADFRNRVSNADAIIICTPEYAFGVPGQLKNSLDWLVSSGNLVEKPVALITAASSGEYAHAALLRTLGALSANIINDACLLVPFIRSKMDSSGNIIDEDLKADLEKILGLTQEQIS